MRILDHLKSVFATIKSTLDNVPKAYYLWGAFFLAVAAAGGVFLYDQAMRADEASRGQILQASGGRI